jgi:hypothetical protein
LKKSSFLIVRCLAGGPPPHLCIDEPQAFLAVGANGEDRMHEQSDIGAVADGAEPPLAPALRLIVDLDKPPLPDDALLCDLLGVWAPEEATRRRILVENPENLYGFPKTA